MQWEEIEGQDEEQEKVLGSVPHDAISVWNITDTRHLGSDDITLRLRPCMRFCIVS